MDISNAKRVSPKDIETSAGGELQKLLSINNSRIGLGSVRGFLLRATDLSRDGPQPRFVFCERSLSPLFQFIIFCSELFFAKTCGGSGRRCKRLIAMSDCVFSLIADLD